MIPGTFKTSHVKSSFPLLLLRHPVTKPPLASILIHAASDEPQLNPNFPLCSSYLNPKKNHRLHPQGLIPLSFMKAETRFIRTNAFPTDLSVHSGSQSEVCMGSSVRIGQRHYNVTSRVPCRPQPFF